MFSYMFKIRPIRLLLLFNPTNVLLFPLSVRMFLPLSHRTPNQKSGNLIFSHDKDRRWAISQLTWHQEYRQALSILFCHFQVVSQKGCRVPAIAADTTFSKERCFIPCLGGSPPWVLKTFYFGKILSFTKVDRVI